MKTKLQNKITNHYNHSLLTLIDIVGVYFLKIITPLILASTFILILPIALIGSIFYSIYLSLHPNRTVHEIEEW